MRIGICTGGGDVPGLNPCIKAVVTRVADGGHEVVGIRRGWAGLLETNPDDEESIAANVMPLTPSAVRTIDRTGGTILHTSRTNPGRVKSGNVPAFLADQAVRRRTARLHGARAPRDRAPRSRRADPDRR